jgi:tetratricopeptide (TPR) repeat protein
MALKGLAELWLAQTYFFTQRYKEAIEFYTWAISIVNEMGQFQHWTPYAKISLERATLMDCGTISPGFEPASYLRENKFKVNEGIIQSMIADILIKLDPKFIPEAEASVRAAIAADQRNQTRWNLGQDYAVYSEVCRIKGDVPMARAHLMRAIEIFRECGADGWVKKYEKELAALA